jgi:eukaryotic translation initiation factor 2C
LSSAGAGLALNVDVANGTFWASQPLVQGARNFCKERNRSLSYITFRDLMMPIKEKDGGWTMSRDFKELRKLSKLRFTIKHRGKEATAKLYTIKQFVFDPKYGQQGGHAKAVKFNQRQPDGSEKEISVYDYFIQKYRIHLEHWYLPLVKTEKDGVFPMEVCTIAPNQRYNFKLSPDQTSKMIKFAVTRPAQRLDAVQHGVGMLKWQEDRYLKHYGIKVDPQMTVTEARVLPNPEVQYTGSKVNPGTSGRWDLRGKKFLVSNLNPLQSWGIAVVSDCVDEPTVKNFMKTFIATYVGHGGKVANKEPVIYRAPRGEDMAETVMKARKLTGDKSKPVYF